MPFRTSLTLADLVQISLPSPGEERMDEREPERASPPERSRADEDLRDLSAELSQLIAELARTPDVDVDVASGWTPDLKPGDLVGGRFELRRELGRGGFGVVFEALDRELGREVAFKAVLPGRRAGARSQEWVRREAEAVARLNHPNIVTLHDFGREPSGPYLIFELLRGETLAQRLRRGPLPLGEAVGLAAQVARVLDHAHREGVVHRDLKPGNVFLCQHGAVKVLDFGLAHLFGRGGVLSGGTPSYMAPEQKKSEAGDARTDLFALGVLLHEMITGIVPARPDREAAGPVAPGPVAQLPRDAAPARLRRLVARMLDRDPGRRPATAREALDELAAVERRLDGGPLRGRAALAALAAAVALATGLAIVAGELAGPAEGPFVVAVADFENGTGDRDMDGLSGLLSTSLEHSRRLRVLPRWRLLALLRDLKLPESARIEGEVARALARAAGAKVLLVGSTRRVGETYAIELEALDPAADRGMFSLVERAPAKAAVFGALDRIADGVRQALDERDEDVRATRIRVAQAVTGSVEAYAAYFRGLDCAQRPSLAANWTSVLGCADHFRRALEADPAFALAHHRLAVLLGMGMGAPRDVEAHASAALRYVDRVPANDAELVRAWRAHLDGRDDDALAGYARVLARDPEHAEALQLSGHIQFNRGQLSAAIPFFTKLLALDPTAEWPLDYLVTALGVERRRGELADLLARLGSGPRTAAASHALVRGWGWLGDAERSVEEARRAVNAHGTLAARSDLAAALAAAGGYAEAEEVLRGIVADEPGDFVARRWLAVAVRAQGRRAEALRVLEASERIAPQSTDPLARAYLVAGDGDPRVLWREAARAEALEPGGAATLAVLLALSGDLVHARSFAGALAPGSAAAVEYEAIASWRGGDAPRAMAMLAALEAAAPWPQEGLPPAYLVAEIALDARDLAEAAAAAERYRALWPRGVWRGWMYPRSLIVSALALHRRGDRDAARHAAERLRELFTRAEPGDPLAAAARAAVEELPK